LQRKDVKCAYKEQEIKDFIVCADKAMECERIRGFVMNNGEDEEESIIKIKHNLRKKDAPQYY
jgi:hypothetical protein